MIKAPVPGNGVRLPVIPTNRRSPWSFASAMAKTLSPLLLLGFSSTSPAQSAGQWTGPGELYGKVCHYCHDTQVGVPLFGRQLEPAYIKETVRQGKTAMPAFKPSEFTDAELDALIDFILHSQGSPVGE